MPPSSSNPTPVGTSRLDSGKAIACPDSHAATTSQHRCARAVREAIEASGMTFRTRVANAKDVGPSVLEIGFATVASATDDKPVAGDVAVIQNDRGGSIVGHVTMDDGSDRVSDVVQTDIWSGPGYRSAKPAFIVDRPK